MADDPKKDAKPDEAPAGGGKSKLMIVLVVTNLLVVAGAGAAVFFAMQQSGTAQAADEPAAPSGGPMGPLVEITTMVVNLSEPGGTRYMRASFHVEAESDETKAEIEARMVPIRSAILLYLSGLTADDTIGPDARQSILDAVRERVEQQAGPRRVRNVYVGELVVQ